MKTFLTYALLFLAACLVRAAITVPGATGADGVFAPSANVVVDLSQAPAGAWDSAPPSPGKGVYDPEKWAVVFKYAAVNIPAGVTVTFKNNASRAPVVWLVSGDVTVDGTVSLSGSPGNIIGLVEPGPGGFRGGKGGRFGSPATSGFGPGGARPGDGYRNPGSQGAGASHAVRGGPFSGLAYGNADARHLIGGSGGGGLLLGDLPSAERASGGGGGGAILLAAQGTVAISGLVEADGGIGGWYGPGYNWGAGGGSGGVVRLIAEKLAGNGQLSARGGSSVMEHANNIGSPGYIKAEAVTFEGNIQTFPQAKAATLSGPVQLWLEESDPSARIVSAGGNAVPADPKAAFGLAPADVDVPANSRKILVETRNLPLTATVTIFVIPQSGDRFELQATHVAGDTSLSTWEASLPGNAGGRYALQVRAVSP